MLKILVNIFYLSYGIVRFSYTKILRRKNISYYWKSFISPFVNIEIDGNGVLNLGSFVRIKSNAKIRVRKDSIITIGQNTFINHGCMLTAREKIYIGENVQIGPNVLFYDHDHDYVNERKNGKTMYKTSPIIVGDNVWIGANSIILRGSTIGENCVIGAGTIVKGKYEKNQMIYNRKYIETKEIEEHI